MSGPIRKMRWWTKMLAGSGIAIAALASSGCGTDGGSSPSTTANTSGQANNLGIELVETAPLVELPGGKYVNQSMAGGDGRTKPYNVYHFKTAEKEWAEHERDITFIEITPEEEPQLLTFDLNGNSQRWALRIPAGSMGVHIDFGSTLDEPE